MPLLDMRPSFSANDARASGLMDAKKPCNAMNRPMLFIAQASHFADAIRCHLSVPVLFAFGILYAENPKSMPMILRMSNPFQIHKTIIILATILVVYFSSIGRTKERFGNKTMNASLLTIMHPMRQPYSYIAIAYRTWLKNMQRTIVIACGDTPHVSRVADFIDTLKSFDRSPRLSHSKGILS